MSAAIELRRLPPAEQDHVDKVIAKYREQPGSLLSMLEDLQEHHPNRFLPAEVLDYLAERADIRKAQIYSVATFYSLFNLKPQGDHTVCICRGTACHTRGSRSLLERARLKLGLQTADEEGGADKLSVTTADRRFTVRTVACFGQCALAPVVEVDHRILSHVNETVLEREVEALRKEGRA
jgi:NADH-quinone oxidoreductase subunit E